MSKVCPTCNTNYPDSTAFCPNDGSTLRAAEIDGSLIGTVVADRYLVTELLGEGGMGKVYRARHVRLPREAAIKILHRHMVRDLDAIARFNREASSASRIEHERVARVFDFGETHDGLVYLAMEYIPGSTLKQLIAKEGAMPDARAATIVRQIAEGLDAAHALNIVHRDLKPDNILVATDANGKDQCKVVDFGIAKAVGPDDVEHALTRTGFIVGTPEYMSPEQLLGQELDQRSDVYSLALVAYQCLTGQTPFDTKTPDRGMMARLTGTPRALSDAAPKRTWSANVQRVLNQGLEREREKRFASAGVFASALATALAAPAVKAQAQAQSQAPAPTAGEAARAVTAEPGRVSQSATPRVSDAVARPKSTPQPKPLAPRPVPAAAVGASAPAAPESRAPRNLAAPPPSAPSRVRVTRGVRFGFPRIPILRWTVTLAVMFFVYLLVTEGSFNRAVRRATRMIRSAESSAMRLVGQQRRAVTTPTAAPPSASPPASAEPSSNPPAAERPNVEPTESEPPSTQPPVDADATPADATPADAAPASAAPVEQTPATDEPVTTRH